MITITSSDSGTARGTATIVPAAPLAAGSTLVVAYTGSPGLRVREVRVNGQPITATYLITTFGAVNVGYVIARLTVAATYLQIPTNTLDGFLSFAWYELADEDHWEAYSLTSQSGTGDGSTPITVTPPTTIADDALIVGLLTESGIEFLTTDWVTDATFVISDINRSSTVGHTTYATAGAQSGEVWAYTPASGVPWGLSMLALYPVALHVGSADVYAAAGSPVLARAGAVEALIGTAATPPPLPPMPEESPLVALPGPPWVAAPGKPFRSQT